MSLRVTLIRVEYDGGRISAELRPNGSAIWYIGEDPTIRYDPASLTLLDRARLRIAEWLVSGRINAPREPEPTP